MFILSQKDGEHIRKENAVCILLKWLKRMLVITTNERMFHIVLCLLTIFRRLRKGGKRCFQKSLYAKQQPLGGDCDGKLFSFVKNCTISIDKVKN